jgi:hypothetical protein
MRHVLAHQGGWDEVLMVAAPILVMVGLLVLATRRARHLRPPDDPPDDPPGTLS